MPYGGEIFQEWRTADREAHALEQQVIRATLQALEAGGSDPSPDIREKAGKMRDLANELFYLAMDEMKRRADANKW
jgi:hypothetical protein